MDKEIDLRPEHGESTPRAVAVLATDPAGDAFIPPHTHRRGQLIHAISGVMLVSAAAGSWVVPTGRGVWVPGGMSRTLRPRTKPLRVKSATSCSPMNFWMP